MSVDAMARAIPTSAASSSPTTAALMPRSADRAHGRVRSAPHDGSAANTRRDPGRKIASVARERTRYELRRAVAGHEFVLTEPDPRLDDLGMEERQHDVAAAEDERAGAIEGVDQPHLAARHPSRAATTITATCTAEDGQLSTAAADASAIAPRGRSHASARAIRQTAMATTTKATSLVRDRTAERGETES